MGTCACHNPPERIAQGRPPKRGDFRAAIAEARVTIGDTATLRGVYSVSAAVRRLEEWILVVYCPWFAENILTPLSSLPHRADTAHMVSFQSKLCQDYD